MDDPAKVRVVERIFREFVQEGRSMSDIARRLHADGFVSPGGTERPWRYDSVRTILENPAYAGDFVSGRFSYGKYNTVLQGKGIKLRKYNRNSQTEWIIRRGTHEPVIDRETFERARVLLAGTKTGRKRFTPETNPFILNGLLRCGKCGSPMWGDTVKERRFYRCGTWQTKGAEHCEGTKVQEGELLRSLADDLSDWMGIDPLEGAVLAGVHKVFSNGEMPAAFHDIKKLLLPSPRPKQDRTRLEKQVEKLKADAAKARGNLALLDAEFIADVQSRIRQLDAEREEIEKELEETKPVPEKDVNEIAREVFFGLIDLTQACCRLSTPDPEPVQCKDPDPEIATRMTELFALPPQGESVAVVRRFLTHVGHIVVRSEKRGTGTGTRHEFTGGEIMFKVGVIKRESNLRNRVS